MIAEKKKTRLLIALIALVVTAIAAMLVVYAVYASRRGGQGAVPAVTPRPSQEVVVREKEVEKIVTVEKEISSQILQDGLRETGMLVTEEYYFTEVISFSSIKRLWKIDLGITESSFLASYDGVVRAGVDLSGASVEKDDEARRITVALPAAEIQSIDIDPESFRLYSEKAGLGNPISAEDFNNALVELEASARDKALDRGLLTRADENAHTLVRNLIGALVDLDEYALVFVRAKG